MRILVFCAIMLGWSSLACQTSKFEESDEAKRIMAAILDLRFEEAQALIITSKTQHPSAILPDYLLLYQKFVAALITEDDSTFVEFSIAQDRFKEMIEDRLVESPYVDFLIGESYLMKSVLRSARGELYKGGWDMNRAYKAYNRCINKYPDFLLVDKSRAVIHSLIGSVKGFRKGLITFFTALEGNVDQGLAEMKSVYESAEWKQSLWHPEIVVLQSLMDFHITKSAEHGLETMETLSQEWHDLALIRYFKGSLHQKTGSTADAETYFCHEDYARVFPYMGLQCGIVKLNQLDQDAIGWLEQYPAQHKGIHYIKEAYQKMAWYHLVINEDEAAYRHHMDILKGVGDTFMGEDEEALRQAEVEDVPHIQLLQARLLCDGGSYANAEDVMKNIDIQKLSYQDQVEYYYRLARIFHLSDQIAKAKANYQMTLEIGKKDKRYFICNSALQLGDINRLTGDVLEAKKMYNRCLSMKPVSFHASLHQKARLGLELLAH